MLGFPIRTPSDLSSVGSSPRLIAASHVLHRLLVPRHPPYALKHLLTKMLASTVQFSNNTRNQTPTSTKPEQPPTKPGETFGGMTEGPVPSYLLPGKNTHVFFQDPTVCRYNHRRRRTEPSPCGDDACQRSTHERPQSHDWGLSGLCQGVCSW